VCSKSNVVFVLAIQLPELIWSPAAGVSGGP
jgi:hypothetical protein